MLTAVQREDTFALARELGFEEIGFLDVRDLVFRHEYRKFCEDNLCGNFGSNYSCPPNCGTPEEMQAKAEAFRYGIVLRSQWSVENTADKAVAASCKAVHNRRTREFVRRRGDGTFLVMAGGSCDLCPTCQAAIGGTCPHPEAAWSCLSAYCIDVAALAQSAGVDFQWDPKRLSYYSVYLF